MGGIWGLGVSHLTRILVLEKLRFSMVVGGGEDKYNASIGSGAGDWGRMTGGWRRGIGLGSAEREFLDVIGSLVADIDIALAVESNSDRRKEFAVRTPSIPPSTQ